MAHTAAVDDDDDDIPVLSGNTQALLQSFYSNRDHALSRFADMKSGVTSTHTSYPLSMSDFAEDWNASQFWYNDATATSLAKRLLDGATHETSIAVVSCPSVFVQMKNLIHEMDVGDSPRICLLEFDERFEVFEEFVKFDFDNPLLLPCGLEGSFDCLLVDPPYHSEDCLKKFAKTVEWLSKIGTTPPKIVVCTGESMGQVIKEAYKGVLPTAFEIVHEQSRLKSEYVCYADFECEAWLWKVEAAEKEDASRSNVWASQSDLQL